MDIPEAPALVSVIVRTLGRASLDRALACVAAQTHRPLEVVLVDAAGSGQLASQAAGDVHVRRAGGEPLARAAAANAGVAAARGQWILFLDDDDEIEPGHVGDLLAAARAEPRARVACTRTRLVDAAGQTVRTMGGPFDRFALFRSNYLAIHAVLFERSFAAEGCRFDETLDQFEDWDFWLQLCMRSRFAFAPGASAIYRADAGTSGAGSGANQDRGALLAGRARLMAKWGAAQAALVEKARHAQARAETLARAGRPEEALRWSARARALQSGEIE